MDVTGRRLTFSMAMNSAETGRKPVISASLLIIAVLLYTYTHTLETRELAQFYDRFAFVPAQFVRSSLDEAHTLVTTHFLHLGAIQIVQIMLSLLTVGILGEVTLGRLRFLQLIVLSAVIALLLNWSIEPFAPVAIIGLSGALSGLFGWLFAHSRTVQYQTNNSKSSTISPFFFSTQRQPAILVVAFWFILQFFNGVAPVGSVQAQNGGVAFFAHVGGFIAGNLLTRWWDKQWG